MKPGGIPFPLIIGPTPPELDLKPVGSRQRVYSRRNLNLYLEHRHFTDDGSFLLASLLRSWWEDVEPKSPNCGDCLFGKDGSCPALVETVDAGPSYRHELTGQTLLQPARIAIRRAAPAPTTCPVAARLLAEVSEAAERKLFVDYLTWAFGFSRAEPVDRTVNRARYRTVPAWPEPLQHLADDWPRTQLRLPALLRTVSHFCGEELIARLDVPALLPHVWLDYAYDPVPGRREAERKLVEYRPTRVSFVLFARGERHAIIVAEPGHYGAPIAEPRELYRVDEETITATLRLERSLRRDGWIVHRFGSWEILNDPSFLWTALRELGLAFERRFDQI